MKTTQHLSPTGNNTQFILTASIVCALSLTACGRKPVTEALPYPVHPSEQPANPVAGTKTLETSVLGAAIDTFEKSPTVENRASADLAFTKLDGTIAALKDRPLKDDGYDRAEATAKLVNLQTYRAAEMIRFTKAQDAVKAESAIKKAVVPVAGATEPIAKTTPFETSRLGAAIDAFEKALTVENRSSVNLAFARLAGVIAELEDRVVRTLGSDRADAVARLNNLQIYRDAGAIRFTKAQDAAFLVTNPARTSFAATPLDSPPVAPSAEPVAKTTTLETERLGAAIDTFEDTPTVENQSSVRLAFAKLDGEVAELDDRVVRTDGSDRAEASAKSVNLQRYRDAEMVRFTRAQEGAYLDKSLPADSRSAAQKVRDANIMVGE